MAVVVLCVPVSGVVRRSRRSRNIVLLVFRSSGMLLVVGDSFAFWAARQCPPDVSICTAGWRGGRIGDDRFRRWVIATVARVRPSRVLLMVGGNDLDRRAFSPRIIMELFHETVLGVLAAGASQVHVFPVPPRTRCRRGVVTVAAYRRRRRLTNMLLRRRFARPGAALPAAFGSFQPAEGSNRCKSKCKSDLVSGFAKTKTAQVWRRARNV